MSYFIGREEYILDSKSRISIPAKMRKNLSESVDTFTITQSFYEPCIALYPNDEWKTYVENRLRKLNHFNPEHRKLINMVTMRSEEVKLDAQQRIVLPKKLIEYAKIEVTAQEVKVRIIGMINYIAIWNPVVHDQYSGENDEEYGRTLLEFFGKDNIE
jgi:MraZ protein